MLWYIIHNILKKFTSMENQTRNLSTFLSGIVLYILFYSYIGAIDFNSNLFLKRFFDLFFFIVIADGLAMVILYNNYYKQKNFKETNETLGSKVSATNVEPNKTSQTKLEIPQKSFFQNLGNKFVDIVVKSKCNKKNTKEIQNILLLNENSNYIDENEGFAKDSALGNAYNTNGRANIK